MTDATFRNGDTVTFRDGTVATFGHATSTHTDTNDRVWMLDGLKRIPPSAWPVEPMEPSGLCPYPASFYIPRGRYGATGGGYVAHDVFGGRHYLKQIPGGSAIAATGSGVRLYGGTKLEIGPQITADESFTVILVTKVFQAPALYQPLLSTMNTGVDYGFYIGCRNNEDVWRGYAAFSGGGVTVAEVAWTTLDWDIGWTAIATQYNKSGLWKTAINSLEGKGFYYEETDISGSGTYTAGSQDVTLNDYTNSTTNSQGMELGAVGVIQGGIVDVKDLALNPYKFIRPSRPQSQIITPATTDNDRVWLL